jgi:hypothetical protein
MSAEEDLLQAVRELAHGLGWITYHTRMSKRSDPGWPDLVLVRGDRIVYRELKSATGKVSEEQQVWLDALAAAGADTGVWRPADLTSGEIQRDLLRGERDRTFGAQLAVRLAQARAKRSATAMRRRGRVLAPRLDP